MKRTQKTIQKDFKMIKLRKEVYKELSNLIKKTEEKTPYLKNILSFNSIILMLLLKNKIKLSKNRYLIKLKGGLNDNKKTLY